MNSAKVKYPFQAITVTKSNNQTKKDRLSTKDDWMNL